MNVFRVVVAEVGSGGNPIVLDVMVEHGVLSSVKKSSAEAMLALVAVIAGPMATPPPPSAPA